MTVCARETQGSVDTDDPGTTRRAVGRTGHNRFKAERVELLLVRTRQRFKNLRGADDNESQ